MITIELWIRAKQVSIEFNLISNAPREILFLRNINSIAVREQRNQIQFDGIIVSDAN